MTLPVGLGEAILLGVVVLSGGFVFRRIRRRKAFVLPVNMDLPSWPSDGSLVVTLRRTWRDSVQDLPMVELDVFGKQVTACPADTAPRSNTYTEWTGKQVPVVLYGLCTLVAGGVHDAKHLIVDIDSVSPPDDYVCIRPVQSAVNDTFVIAETRGFRTEFWGDMPLIVYRAIVQRGTRGGDIVVDLAMPANTDTPLVSGTFVYGSVRWFCRLVTA